MHIIDGKQIAGEIVTGLKNRPKPDKFFAAILVGDDPASINFLKQKEKVAFELGVDFRLYTLPAATTTDELRREIARLAGPKQCGGCIVQLPLPEGVSKHYVLNAIPKEKDLDILSEPALGSFYTGRNAIVPPSVAVVEEILKREHCPLRELKVVVVGAGFLVGKPIGFWLQNRVAELTVLDSKVKDIKAHLRDADVVISGVGKAHLFSARDLKDNAVVMDFGWDRFEGKISGDFDPTGVEEKNISYTPTPGGTGPVLVAKLLENFYILHSTQK